MNVVEGLFAFLGQLTVEAFGREMRQSTLCSRVRLNISNMTSTNDIEPALKYAWKKLRFEQPNLATTVENNKLVYEVLEDDSAVQKWLQETFIVDSSSSDGEQAYHRVKLMRQSSLTYVPKSCELLFTIHHSLTDGLGTLQFWGRFLTVVTEALEPVAHTAISFGTEHTRLPPAKEELFGCPEHPSPENAERLRQLSAEWSDIFPGVGHISKHGTVPPGRCLNEQVKFSVDKTNAIVKACKSKGISVTTAVHAAYIYVLAKNPNPSSRKSHYANFGIFNLRRHMPESYKSYMIALYMTWHVFSIGLPSTYWDIVKALNTYYKTPFNDSNKEESLKLAPHVEGALMSAIGKVRSNSNPITYTDAIVSSWGIAETYCKRSYSGPSVHIEVEDMLPGIDMFVDQPMFTIYTFRDQLRLVYGFNEAFQDPADVQAFYNQIEKVLDAELLS